jgi:hypothetical protein
MKITVIDVANIGAQMANMSKEQLIEFIKDSIPDKFYIEEYADSFLSDKFIYGLINEKEETEDIPELLVLKLADEKGIYFDKNANRENNKESNNKNTIITLANPMTIYLKDGFFRNDPVYNRNINFNMVVYKKQFFEDIDLKELLNLVEYIKLFKNVYGRMDKVLLKTIQERNEKLIDFIENDKINEANNDNKGEMKNVEANDKNNNKGEVKNDAEVKNNDKGEVKNDAKTTILNSFNSYIKRIINILNDYDAAFLLDKEEIDKMIERKIAHNNIIVIQDKDIFKKKFLDTIRNNIIKSKFNNKKLSPNEIKFIDNEVNKFIEKDTFIKDNKCMHIKAYFKLNTSKTLPDKKYWLHKLDEFLPSEIKKDGLLTCEVCSQEFICTHTIELIKFSSIFNNINQINRAMTKYVNDNIEGAKHYCKYCGEYLYDADLPAINSSGFNMETTPIEEILWRELKNILNHVRFNIVTKTKNIYTIDPEKFIKKGILTLVPWLELIQKQERRNKTITNEELTAILNIYGAVYVTTLMVVLSLNDPIIELNRPKITSKKTDVITKIIYDYITGYKINDLRLLGQKINLANINIKISAAYALMYNTYKGDSQITENLTEFYEFIINSDPIARQLKFHGDANSIINSKNKNIYSSVIIPPERSDYSGALIRIYAEAYKDGIWPAHIDKLSAFIPKLNYERWLNKSIFLEGFKKLLKKPAKKISLCDFFDEKGNKYIWNIFIYKYDGKEMEFKINKIFDVPYEAVLIDMKTNEGILKSKLPKISNEIIEKAIKDNFEFYNKFNKFENYCQGKDNLDSEHEFKDGICSKCGFNQNWSESDAEAQEYIRQRDKAGEKIKEKINENIDEKIDEKINKMIIDEKINEEINEKFSKKIIKNSLLIKEFSTLAEFDIKKIELADHTFASRDDINIISLISLLQRMTFEYKDFQLAANKSFMALTGPIEYYKNKYRDMGDFNPPDIDNNIDMAVDGRLLMPVDEIYSFLLQLLAETFLPACRDLPACKLFCKEQMANYIKSMEMQIRPESWNSWEGTNATIIKVMSSETAEERQTININEFEVPVELADEMEKKSNFALEYDLDKDVDNDDNLEMRESD